MSYSTPTDVRAALVPGGGPEPAEAGTAASLENAQIQDSIDEADARIDSYLTARYVTPVASPTTTIKALSRDIAAYLATLTWRRNKDFTDNDPVARRYSVAMSYLIAISKGDATLDIPQDTGNASSGQAGTAMNGYRGSLFTADDFSLRQSTFGLGVYGDDARWL